MKYILILCLVLSVAMPSYAAEMSKAPDDPASMLALAQQGDSNAQLNLGNYYATPHNAAPDMEEAAKWYRKAADQGNAEAQYRLGDLYYNGKGEVAQSYEEAYFWFALSSKAGNKNFVGDRDETANHLTPEQLAAVQKRVDEWAPATKK
jgi:TPR repeat protein